MAGMGQKRVLGKRIRDRPVDRLGLRVNNGELSVDVYMGGTTWTCGTWLRWKMISR